MGTTRLISFRLTDAAIAMLDHLRDKNESINLAAQRLLVERLGLPAKASDTDAAASALAVNNIVDKIVNSEYFRAAVLDQMGSVISSVNGKNAEIEQTVEKLGEAVRQLTSRFDSLSPVGDTHEREFVVTNDDITIEMSVEADNEHDYGVDVEGDIEVTPEPEPDVTPDALQLPVADDAIAAEEPPPLMLGPVQLAERFKLAEKTIRDNAGKLTPEAFAKRYDKKDLDYYWYPQKDNPILQFVAVKKDDAQTVEAVQDTPLLDLIGATA